MKFVAALSLLLSSTLVADAFVVQRHSTTAQSAAVSHVQGGSNYYRSNQSTALWMSDESEEGVDTEARAGEGAEEDAPEGEEEEAPEVEDDPEVVAIKEEIDQLESTLKEKRRELAYVSDKADEYTKSGYARKVAEMENMRRARSVSVCAGCCCGWCWSSMTMKFLVLLLTDTCCHPKQYATYFADVGIVEQIWCHGRCSRLILAGPGYSE